MVTVKDEITIASFFPWTTLSLHWHGWEIDKISFAQITDDVRGRLALDGWYFELVLFSNQIQR